RIVVMNAGGVEQEGTARDLYERPATLFVATFIGSPPINLFDGVVAGNAVKVRDATLPLQSSAAGAVVVGIRPETVRANGGGMPARIAAVGFVEAGADARLREGDDVALAYAPRDVLLFDKASGRRLETRIVS